MLFFFAFYCPGKPLVILNFKILEIAHQIVGCEDSLRRLIWA
jgi:hypothetical protein